MSDGGTAMRAAKTFLRDNVAMARDRDDDRTFHQFRYDTSGLRGRRLRVLLDIPTNDAGWPQGLPKGITDVIAIDDEPNVNLSVRVLLPDDPDCVAFVAFDQLALYDEPVSRHLRWDGRYCGNVGNGCPRSPRGLYGSGVLSLVATPRPGAVGNGATHPSARIPTMPFCSRSSPTATRPGSTRNKPAPRAF